MLVDFVPASGESKPVLGVGCGLTISLRMPDTFFKAY
jgi:hypothetical protein